MAPGEQAENPGSRRKAISTYVIRRISAVLPVLFLVTVIAFGIVHLLPGDVVDTIMGENIDPVRRAALRAELRLDDPLYIQYLRWLDGVLHGDLGRSLRRGNPILGELGYRLPVTTQLVAMGMLIAVIVGIPLGIASAARKNSPLDVVATVFATAGIAMPGFWLGILLILLFGQQLGWLPTSGYVPLTTDPIASIQHMLLPATALGLNLTAVVMRQTRSGLLGVLGQDYIRVARAKGLSEQLVLWRHALKNALTPIITVIAIQTGRLIGTSVVIETIFALPGMGRLVATAVFQRDLTVVQAGLLVFGSAVTLTSLIGDILYRSVDPRVRYS